MAGVGLCCQDSGDRTGVQGRRVERTQDHLILTQIPCRAVASGPRALGTGHRAEHTEVTTQTLQHCEPCPLGVPGLSRERGQNGVLERFSQVTTAPVPC